MFDKKCSWLPSVGYVIQHAKSESHRIVLAILDSPRRWIRVCWTAALCCCFSITLGQTCCSLSASILKSKGTIMHTFTCTLYQPSPSHFFSFFHPKNPSSRKLSNHVIYTSTIHHDHVTFWNLDLFIHCTVKCSGEVPQSMLVHMPLNNIKYYVHTDLIWEKSTLILIIHMYLVLFIQTCACFVLTLVRVHVCCY